MVYMNIIFNSEHTQTANIYVILTTLNSTVRDDASYVAVLTPTTMMKPTMIERKSTLN